MFEPDSDVAGQGDLVEFMFQDVQLYGRVLPSQCQNSHVIDLTMNDNLDEIDFEHERTVINHKNYRILKRR